MAECRPRWLLRGFAGAVTSASASISAPCCISAEKAVIADSRSQVGVGGHGTSLNDMCAGGAAANAVHL